MIHPDMQYEMVRYQQQARVAASQLRSEARAARRARRDEQPSWLAALISRFHHAAGAGARALDASERVSVKGAAAPPVGEAAPA
jgi:hypothetical protein